MQTTANHLLITGARNGLGLAALRGLGLAAALVAWLAPVHAQVPGGAVFALGFDFEGEPARSQILYPGSAQPPTPVRGLRSETTQINAATYDPATGELIISGLFTAAGGSEGDLHALTVDPVRGVVSERTVAAGGSADAIKALALDEHGRILTAGPAGLYLRDRESGAVLSRFDVGGSRAWNALSYDPTSRTLFAATFGVVSGGEVWAFDLAGPGGQLLFRMSDQGLDPRITSLWAEPVPQGRLTIGTLDETGPLTLFDRASLTLSPGPAVPTGAAALAGFSAAQVWFLGAGNPSSDLHELDVDTGTATLAHSFQAPFATSALALTPSEGQMFATPGEVFLNEDLDLRLSAFTLPMAPLSLRLTAFGIQGFTFFPDSPFFDGVADSVGALRLRLRASRATYRGLSPGDWMEFRTFYFDLANVQVRATNAVRITAR